MPSAIQGLKRNIHGDVLPKPGLFDNQDLVSKILSFLPFQDIVPLRGVNWLFYKAAPRGLLLQYVESKQLSFKDLTRYQKWSSSASLIQILDQTKHLRSLTLQGCPATDLPAIFSSKRCSFLTEIQLEENEHLTDAAASAMTGALPRLLVLSLKKCVRIGALTCEAIGQKYPNLRKLDLMLCCQINATGLSHIARSCRQLQVLNLRGCVHISDAGIEQLAMSCIELEELDLRDMYQITDLSLVALSAHLKKLTILDLSHCSKLTDQGVQALAQGCLALTSLSLWSCDQIADGALVSMALHLRSLELLNLRACRNITSSGLRAVIESCFHLTSLDIMLCRRISQGMIAQLKERPNLQLQYSPN